MTVGRSKRHSFLALIFIVNKIFLNGHAIADEDALLYPTSILHSVLACDSVN